VKSFADYLSEAPAVGSYRQGGLSTRKIQKKLRVFDFDDTLAVTQSFIHVNDASGKRIKTLGSGGFKTYVRKQGEVFDFSDFGKILNPRVIEPIMSSLKRVVGKGERAFVLTGRGSNKPVEEWLKTQGVHVEVIALGSKSKNPAELAYNKTKWIADQIRKHGWTHIEVFEDSVENLTAMEKLKKEFPAVTFVLRNVGHYAKTMHEPEGINTSS